MAAAIENYKNSQKQPTNNMPAYPNTANKHFAELMQGIHLDIEAMGKTVLQCQRESTEAISSDMRQANQCINRRIEDLAEDYDIKHNIVTQRLNYINTQQQLTTNALSSTTPAAKSTWSTPFDFEHRLNNKYELTNSSNPRRFRPSPLTPINLSHNINEQANTAMPPSALRLLSKYEDHNLTNAIPVNVMTQTTTLPSRTQATNGSRRSVIDLTSPLTSTMNVRNAGRQPENEDDHYTNRRPNSNPNADGGGGGGPNDPDNEGPNDPSDNRRSNNPSDNALSRPTIGEFKQIGLQFPPVDHSDDPSWMVRVFKNFHRAILTECNRTLTKNAKLFGGRIVKSSLINYGCDWVSSSLMCLFSAHRSTNTHDNNMKFKTEQNRMHDTAVTMEERGVPDGEIFNWLKQIFIETWATQRPAAYTALLLRFQVCPGTSLEHALAALSAAVEVSRDVDTNPAQDATRVQAIIDFVGDQFPSMHQFLSQSCTPAETSSLQLMELLHTQREAKHRAGALRYPQDDIANTAVYGDIVDRSRRSILNATARRYNLRPRPTELNAMDEIRTSENYNAKNKNANPNYENRVSRADAICTNCGERGHFWGTCPRPFDAPRHLSAASTGVPHAKDLEHFSRVQTRIQGGMFNNRRNFNNNSYSSYTGP
jgi:hypothetical protein